jgi:hypothetical protein
MRLKIEEDRPPVRSVTVITPTIGSEHLEKNLFSVDAASNYFANLVVSHKFEASILHL